MLSAYNSSIFLEWGGGGEWGAQKILFDYYNPQGLHQILDRNCGEGTGTCTSCLLGGGCSAQEKIWQSETEGRGEGDVLLSGYTGLI